MIARRRFSFALVVVALAAMPAARLSAQRGDPCRFDAVCRFLEQNIGLKPPITLVQLRRFATLEGEKRSAVTNTHVAAQTDTTHELRYPGLTILVYAPATGSVLLQRIELTSARHPLPLKLRFGKSTFDDVQDALGLPKNIEHLPDGGSRWHYDNVEGTASIVFEFEPEPSMRIRRVQWLFQVD